MKKNEKIRQTFGGFIFLLYFCRKIIKIYAMTAIELKYELFRDIESISDERILQKIASYIKTISRNRMMTSRCCMTQNQDAMPMRKLLRPLKKV